LDSALAEISQTSGMPIFITEADWMELIGQT